MQRSYNYKLIEASPDGKIVVDYKEGSQQFTFQDSVVIEFVKMIKKSGVTQGYNMGSYLHIKSKNSEGNYNEDKMDLSAARKFLNENGVQFAEVQQPI